MHEHTLWLQQYPDGGNGGSGGLDARVVHSKVFPSATLMTVPTAISSPHTGEWVVVLVRPRLSCLARGILVAALARALVRRFDLAAT